MRLLVFMRVHMRTRCVCFLSPFLIVFVSMAWRRSAAALVQATLLISSTEANSSRKHFAGKIWSRTGLWSFKRVIRRAHVLSLWALKWYILSRRRDIQRSYFTSQTIAHLPQRSIPQVNRKLSCADEQFCGILSRQRGFTFLS